MECVCVWVECLFGECRGCVDRTVQSEPKARVTDSNSCVDSTIAGAGALRLDLITRDREEKK